ncbi:YfjI family protein [Bythopirellula polymerisocia]|uniref:DUF3987 domain-containing protein n=1 Tax=Bythopirellula polymerisocia TaxID=2528003 RepID=A0A5C6CT54_9BACT|nr:YfjI family protein [Bythopirellula polymerisocia]TWU27568.1 hypothetical protein Pla144_23450 [Bythopirellula polymerisocia]
MVPPTGNSPLFDVAEIRRALDLLLLPDQVTEVRILNGTTSKDRWTGTYSGYFDDREKLIESLGCIRSATGIYIIPNPVDESLLARACNRIIRTPKGQSTSDNDIKRRRWLLIDCDAVRPAGISASDEEHEAALARARRIYGYLSKRGWPEPIVADSGNGGHLLYLIDLPRGDEGLVQRVLAALAELFDDDIVKVDVKVANPARIWKLYGTLACKGDNIPFRPHRMSKILSAPGTLVEVSLRQLESAALPASSPSPNRPTQTSFDIDEFIQKHQLDVSDPHDYQGGRCWKFQTSPMCDHGGDGSFLIQFPNGALAASCHHNSCSWNWHDLRNKFDPRPQNKPSGDKTSSNHGSREVLSPPGLNIIPRAVPFPVQALPRCIRHFVEAAAEAIGCDPSFIALPLLGCLAEIIGNRRVIELKATWTEPAIIWAVIIGKSGSAKSPALNLATRYLKEIQKAAFETHAVLLEQHKVAAANYDKDYAKWKTDKKGHDDPPEKPKEPVCRRYITSDSTIEALVNLLAVQPDGVLVVRDELAGWVNGIAEYKGGKGSDLGHWLAFWSAQPVTIDRKTGAIKTVHVPRASANIVGGIQPGILRTAIGREHMQDGLCARLLLAMPETNPIKWSERVIDSNVELLLQEVFAQLASLEADFDEDEHPIPVRMQLTPEAKTLWVEYYNRHRQEMTGLDDDSTSAWSKLEAYTARFALIFQLCDWAAGDASGENQIDAQAMDSAIELSDWFGAESLRMYAVLSESDEQRDTRELLDLIRRRGGSVTPRELARSSRRYREAGVAEATLEELVRMKYGRWEMQASGPKGGAPTQEFVLADTGAGDTTIKISEQEEVLSPATGHFVFPEDPVNRLFAEAVDPDLYEVS